MKTKFTLLGFGADELVAFERDVPRDLALMFLPPNPVGDYPMRIRFARIMAPDCPDDLEYFLGEVQMSVNCDGDGE